MARISGRDESSRKVVKLTLELSKEDKAQIADLLKEPMRMTLNLHDNGDLELVFEESRR